MVEAINQERIEKGLSATWELMGFADEDSEKWSIEQEGYPVFSLNFIEKYPEQLHLIIAIADPIVKQKMAARYMDYSFPCMVHPTALVAKTAVIGKGSIIQAGAVISTDTIVGNFTIINLHCTVGHDAFIGGVFYTSCGN